MLTEMVGRARLLEEAQKRKVIDGFRSRVAEVASVVDPAKLEQEAVTAAEKVDVSEELTRLGSHLDAFSAELSNGAGPLGKKLDFLLQEMQREVSTLLAKSALMDLTRAGLEIRHLIEQLREQVNNVA